MEILEIEQMRLKHRISVGRLCAASGVAESSYLRIRAQSQQPKPDTVAKLAAGLSMAQRNERPLPARKLFRMLLGQLAYERDMDIALVLAHQPQLKATSDPKWMEISRLRDIAIYMLHAVLGLSNADVARAAGVTQAAVTITVQKMENKRDEPGLDRMFAVLEKAVSG